MPESSDKFIHSDIIAPTPSELEIQIIADKTYMLLAIKELEKRLEDRFTASQAAITKAEVASEKRFDGVNEFRAQQKDMILTLVLKAEYEVTRQAMQAVIDALRRDLTTVKDDAQKQLFMVKEDLGKKIEDLSRSRDTISGRSAGLNQFWAVLIVVIMAVAAIVGLVLKK